MDAPAYSRSIYDNFTTADGGDLDGRCTQEYSIDWQTQVLAMQTTLNNMLGNGELCSDEGESLTVVYSAAGFFSQENEVGKYNNTFQSSRATMYTITIWQ